MLQSDEMTELLASRPLRPMRQFRGGAGRLGLVGDGTVIFCAVWRVPPIVCDRIVRLSRSLFRRRTRYFGRDRPWYLFVRVSAYVRRVTWSRESRIEVVCKGLCGFFCDTMTAVCRCASVLGLPISIALDRGGSLLGDLSCTSLVAGRAFCRALVRRDAIWGDVNLQVVASEFGVYAWNMGWGT